MELNAQGPTCSKGLRSLHNAVVTYFKASRLCLAQVLEMPAGLSKLKLSKAPRTAGGESSCSTCPL